MARRALKTGTREARRGSSAVVTTCPECCCPSCRLDPCSEDCEPIYVRSCQRPACDVVIRGGICYHGCTPAEPPPGTELVDVSELECVVDCDDERCAETCGDRWVPGRPCIPCGDKRIPTGINCTPIYWWLPALGGRTACFVYQFFYAPVGGLCWIFDPAVTVAESEIPPGAGREGEPPDPNRMFADCCSCPSTPAGCAPETFDFVCPAGTEREGTILQPPITCCCENGATYRVCVTGYRREFTGFLPDIVLGTYTETAPATCVDLVGTSGSVPDLVADRVYPNSPGLNGPVVVTAPASRVCPVFANYLTVSDPSGWCDVLPTPDPPPSTPMSEWLRILSWEDTRACGRQTFSAEWEVLGLPPGFSGVATFADLVLRTRTRISWTVNVTVLSPGPCQDGCPQAATMLLAGGCRGCGGRELVPA